MLSLNVCHTYIERADTPELNHQIREWLAQHYRCFIAAPTRPATHAAAGKHPGESFPDESNDMGVRAAREQAEQTPRGYLKELVVEAALAHGKDAT